MSDPILSSDVPPPADAPRPAKSKPAEKAAATGDTITLPPGIPLRKSLIPELYRFVRNIPADAPYDQLGAMAQSAGWIWRMVERDSYSSSPGLYCVRFDVMIGKSTSDLELEFFDTISMSVPVEAPSPSLIARLNAQVALTYMVFNRLPPQVQQAPAPQPEPVAAPVRDDEPVWQKEVEEPITIRASRTMDGIPVFENLYEREGNPDKLVEAALRRFDEAVNEIDEPTLLNVLWSKNDAAVEFIKDFGNESAVARLSAMFRDRAKTISSPNYRRN